MNKTYSQEDDDPLQAIKDFGAQWSAYFSGVQQLMADYDQLKLYVSKLEEEKAQWAADKAQWAADKAQWATEKVQLEDAIEQARKGDEWSSRVTYENIVDQIASNEDAAQRDNARRLIEPLLKRSQVTQLRKDIKKRVKELNEESGNTFNNYGVYTEVQQGGININNKKDGSN